MSPPILLSALALCAALGLPRPGQAAAHAAATSTEAARSATPMRLSSQVRPQAAALGLTVDPARPRYTGQVAITLQLARAEREITLHAKDLDLARVQLAQGARLIPARVQRLDAERVRLRLDRPAAAGAAELQISFAGTLQDKDVYGFFRQRDGDQWVAITQFEAVGARLAFPLFDEPGWKIPWTLSLTIPEALEAVGNTPVNRSLTATSVLPVGSTDTLPPPGWKTLHFSPTPPLPSYLLAWAVGALQAWPGASAGEVPVRVLSAGGRAADGAYAADITARIVASLEGYFGMPFPFAKLDSLAIPVTVDFGAMEHPGLITYASSLLLARPGELTPAFQRGYVATAAHELAHQWFGNLVTMAWWDDLWLNESFASWMEVRTTAALMPAWGWETQRQAARAEAMRADRLASARRIQQPVQHDEDMGNLWDAITYQKGQTVLGMVEAWLGEQRFREAVQHYLQRHAWGHARSDDFLAALGALDPTLPGALRSFTTQPGIPLVDVALDCPAGAAPRLRLAQSRLLPLGSPAVQGAPQRWQIPLRLRTPAGDSRLLLSTAEATLDLPDTDCPAWVQANADGLGYYRVRYAADGLLRLAAAPGLDTGEVLALLDDARGLHEAGALDSATLLALVQRFAGHPRREVVELAAELLKQHRRLLPPGPQPAYAALWQQAFGDRARLLGWLPGGPEADDSPMLLRAALLPLLADAGEDTALRAQARQLAPSLLAPPTAPTLLAAADTTQPPAAAPESGSVPPAGSLPAPAVPVALRGAVLNSAALDADAALFNRLVAALKASGDRPLRHDLLSALGHVRDPALAERALALLLDPGIDVRDSLPRLLAAMADDAASRRLALRFVQQNLKPLTARMGRDDPAGLPRHFDQACSDDEARALQATFGPTAGRYQGGQLALTRTLEAVRLCTAWRARQAGGL